MKKYYKRLIEKKISDSLNRIGGILIEGMKWCGKSTTASTLAKSIVELQVPAIHNLYSNYVATNDTNLLSKEKPILFDEWQTIPELWNYIRSAIDKSDNLGEYILTGSYVPIRDTKMHSGTGRILRIRMRTLSLFESLESTGDVSLELLFKKQLSIEGHDNRSLLEICHLICRGGFPKTIASNFVDYQESKFYVESLINQDFTEIEGIRVNPKRAKHILKSLARNVGTSVSNTTILSDIVSNYSEMDMKTLMSYISIFNRLFVLEYVPVWNPRLRSKSSIRTKETIYFTDTSIVTAILDANPNDLINDIDTLGHIFENFVIRDLRIYAESISGELFTYHDSSGLEVDAIIHLSNGDYGLIEIKLGGEKLIESATNSLLKLKNKIDTSVMKEPSFLMVVVANGYAYKTSNGILVVPIGLLKP